MEPETILSVVAVLCAIFALFQTVWQVKVSNKQSLFDFRLQLFLEFKSLNQLYEDNINILNSILNENYDMVEMLCPNLMNSIYLEECCEAFIEPLKDYRHKIFLKKREELREKSLKAEMLFNKKYSTVVSEFIKLYEQLLHKLYQFRIAIEKRNVASLEENKEWYKKYCNQLGFKELIEKMHLLFYEIKDKNIIEKIKKDINII